MKKVLITGGSGTVGRAFMQTYSNEYEFAIFSRNETLQTETKKLYNISKAYIGSIENIRTLYCCFEDFMPDIVIHAAALKHVDIAERQPMQAISVNVSGSLNVIKVCNEYRVPITVGISTDKACNQRNVYGITKYLMERALLDSNTSACRFSACRFANVARSNGSVLPFWEKLIKDGKSIKLTDPLMNRMMFTRYEAAALVRKTIDLTEKNNGGFILSKLMKSVNMLRMAKMISDKIEVVGARDGEKIDEDLISEKELEYTELIEDNYIRINKNINTNIDTRLKYPLNTKTCQVMTDEEVLSIIRL